MEDHWKIMEPKRPGLCISVIGGAKSFKLDNKMRETFNAGLIKVYCLILHLFLLLFLLPLPSINLAPSSHSSSSKKNKNCSSFGFLTFELNIHIRKPIPYLLFFLKAPPYLKNTGTFLSILQKQYIFFLFIIVYLKGIKNINNINNTRNISYINWSFNQLKLF